MIPVNRTTHQEIFEMQEDLAEYFADNYFPLTGETYWKIIETIAQVKLVELREGVKGDWE